MSRSIERADFEAIYKLYADKAVKRFNLTGNHPPQLYGVKLGKELGKIEGTYSLNKVAPLFFDGTFPKAQIRDLLAQLTTPGSPIRKMAVQFDVILPDIVVQINEVWQSNKKKPEGMSDAEFKKLEHQLPSEDPNREEAIAVFMHAYQYSTMGSCPIRSKPRRHAVMGEMFPEDGKMTGRLSLTIDDE